MRLLLRNLTRFEYLPYEGLTDDLDEYGRHTGVPKPSYGSPIEYRGNISTPSGSVVQAFDGLEVRYSHVLVMDDPSLDIREEGKIRWRGKMYSITAVRPSLNVLSVALVADTMEDEKRRPNKGQT